MYENMALKQDIFKRLDEICKPSAILCTNTSTINIDMVSVFFLFLICSDRVTSGLTA